jgi:hypothetical protein
MSTNAVRGIDTSVAPVDMLVFFYLPLDWHSRSP